MPPSSLLSVMGAHAQPSAPEPTPMASKLPSLSAIPASVCANSARERRLLDELAELEFPAAWEARVLDFVNSVDTGVSDTAEGAVCGKAAKKHTRNPVPEKAAAPASDHAFSVSLGLQDALTWRACQAPAAGRALDALLRHAWVRDYAVPHEGGILGLVAAYDLPRETLHLALTNVRDIQPPNLVRAVLRRSRSELDVRNVAAAAAILTYPHADVEVLPVLTRRLASEPELVPRLLELLSSCFNGRFAEDCDEDGATRSGADFDADAAGGEPREVVRAAARWASHIVDSQFGSSLAGNGKSAVVDLLDTIRPWVQAYDKCSEAAAVLGSLISGAKRHAARRLAAEQNEHYRSMAGTLLRARPSPLDPKECYVVEGFCL